MLHRSKCCGFDFLYLTAEAKLTVVVVVVIADLYSSSLLTQALTSREGSLASRLIQDRADMLQMELPSFTTRRLALVSFPVGGQEGEMGEGARQKQQRPAEMLFYA